MADYINTIDSLKEVSYNINYGLALLVFFGVLFVEVLIYTQIADNKNEARKQDLVLYTSTIIEIVAMAYFIVGTLCWLNDNLSYDKAYQDGLYNHYSEYKDNIKSVSIPEDKSYKFNLVVNVDNTDYTITLDKYANNYEEVDTQDSEESYYELFRDTKNKKIRIRKYVGSSEYDKMTSNTFKEK